MSSSPAHRNRWLALEHELQARRSQCYKPPLEPRSQPTPAIPPALAQSLDQGHPPAAVWQSLAVQLTHNQSRRSRRSPGLDDKLPTPQFILDQAAPLPPPSSPVERSFRLSFPQPRPVPLHHSSMRLSDTPEDNPSLDDWKNLADQIQQTRASNPRS